MIVGFFACAIIVIDIATNNIDSINFLIVKIDFVIRCKFILFLQISKLFNKKKPSEDDFLYQAVILKINVCIFHGNG